MGDMDASVRRNRLVRRAFTLIELIIVVSIIAILALLILANFHLIVARTKTTRAKSDMRALMYGIEARAVDVGRYPDILFDLTLEDRLKNLTTPIAYVSSKGEDPFGDDVPFSYPSSYRYRVFQMVTDQDPFHAQLFFHPFGWGFRQQANAPNASYYFCSQGPDLEPNISFNRPWDFFLPYDPTNGTVSEGDIFRYGPGGGYHGG